MNHVLVATAALLLAEVFLVAAITKIADPAGSRSAMVDFGAPRPWAAALGLILPLLELGVAIGLLTGSSARIPALAATALLALFMVAIAANLVRGRHPDCHCFGQLHSAPAGLRTLARNGMLAVLAGFVLWQSWSGTRPIAWSTLGATTLATALAVSILLAFVMVRSDLVVGALRRNPWLHRRMNDLEKALYDYRIARARRSEGLPVGTTAPPFQLRTLDGGGAGLDSLLELRRPVLLLVVDPHCMKCDELLPEVAEWHQRYASELAIAVVTSGAPEANASKMIEQPAERVLLQKDRELEGAYRLLFTPTAVLIAQDGTIASKPAAAAEEIRALVQHAAAQSQVAVSTA